MTVTTELDADRAQDTHGMYARLGAEAPVHPVLYEEGVRAWLVTRYAHALALLNDPRRIKDPSRAPAQFAPDRARPYQPSVFKSMLMLDTPEHTRIRRLVVKAFTARTVQRMQPRVEAIANELLDALDRSDTTDPVDLIADYAGPLPIRVISHIWPLLQQRTPSQVFEYVLCAEEHFAEGMLSRRMSRRHWRYGVLEPHRNHVNGLPPR